VYPQSVIDRRLNLLSSATVLHVGYFSGLTQYISNDTNTSQLKHQLKFNANIGQTPTVATVSMDHNVTDPLL
jgi:alanine racemase